jgi:hypothetical protein
MIKTGPDVPEARLKIIEKLASERDRRPSELPRLVVGAERPVWVRPCSSSLS